MRIHIDEVRLSYDGHRSLVNAHVKPGWFMRIFLRAKNVPVMFIGHGTQWESYPDYLPIAKNIKELLTATEKRWAHLKRMNPRLNLAEIARMINKHF